MEVEDAIVKFLKSEMLIGANESLKPDDSLTAGGILDSFSLMALLDHLEGKFSIKFPRHELTKKDFESIRSIESVVHRVRTGAR